MSVQAPIRSALAESDPAVAALVDEEARRQAETICLIPSENHVSRAVLEALGSVLTDKYSEGYADRRYYEGNAIVDRIELLAIERARAARRSTRAVPTPRCCQPSITVHETSARVGSSGTRA